MVRRTRSRGGWAGLCWLALVDAVAETDGREERDAPDSNDDIPNPTFYQTMEGHSNGFVQPIPGDVPLPAPYPAGEPIPHPVVGGKQPASYSMVQHASADGSESLSSASSDDDDDGGDNDNGGAYEQDEDFQAQQNGEGSSGSNSTEDDDEDEQPVVKRPKLKLVSKGKQRQTVDDPENDPELYGLRRSVRLHRAPRRGWWFVPGWPRGQS